MQRDLKAALDGALAGGIATLAMSLVMLASEKVGGMDRHPPDEIAGAALDAVGLPDASEKETDALAMALHLAFGIGMGGLFGLLHRRLRPPVPPALHGLIFGSLVWAVSYKGWVPALRIMPPPERDLPGRPETMLLAHWVYGGILGTMVGRHDE